MSPALRDLAVLYSRRYSSLSKISKKAEEAVKKSKEAVEDIAKDSNVAETAEKLKQQAVAATTVLGEKLSQAQSLGKATMEELFKSSSSSSSSSSSGKESTSSSSSSTTAADEKAGQKTNEEEQQKTDTNTPPHNNNNRLKNFFSTAVEEMKAAILPEAPKASALRGASAKATNIQTSDVTHLAIAEQPEESAWKRQFREMNDTLGSHAFFKRVSDTLKDSKIAKAGGDFSESIRERWETSDSAFVHRIQDATDSFFTESEAAQALREIRGRDPNFDMVEFLRLLRADVPLLIKAYLTGDEALIKDHCSPEMIERLTGIMRAQKEAGLTPDPTLLDTSEVELVDLKMLEDNPIIVTQFTCQQINCTRDSHGNVVEGAPDEVHRVYYYWAVQQEEQGYVGEDGKTHPPRWQLREMMIRGMHHLL